MPPEASVAQLRLLSLALDDALSRDDLDEAFALLQRRDECLMHLEASAAELAGEELRELVAINNRLTTRIRASQTRLADDARTNAKTAQAVRAYHGQAA